MLSLTTGDGRLCVYQCLCCVVEEAEHERTHALSSEGRKGGTLAPTLATLDLTNSCKVRYRHFLVHLRFKRWRKR